MELKKAYGLVTAVGTKLGEKAREDATVVECLRGAGDADAFRITVRLLAEDLLPAAVLRAFLEDVVDDEGWEKWRARLVLQVKMVRDGGKPAPGHEKRGPAL